MAEAREINKEEAQRIVGTRIKVAMKFAPDIVGYLIREERRKVKGKESERNVLFFRFKPLDPEKNEVDVQTSDILRL